MLPVAVLAPCDATDGPKDALIAQPAACEFGPAMITRAEQATHTSACLTLKGAEVARRSCEGPHDPETSACLGAGQPLPASGFA